MENINQQEEVITNQDTIDTDSTTVKSYTQEEVDKMIQSEADRRVNEALRKERSKNDEANKLKGMSEDEKANYELNKKVTELEEREAVIAQKELFAEASKQIVDKGLPQEVAQFLVTKDADSTMSNITTFEGVFKKMIDGEISKRIATGTPKATASTNGTITKEQFKKMTLAKQAELYKSNPDLYKSLTQ